MPNAENIISRPLKEGDFWVYDLQTTTVANNNRRLALEVDVLGMVAELPKFNQEKLPEIEQLKARIEKLEAELKKETPPPAEEKEKMVRQEIKDYLEDLQQAPSFAPPAKTRDEVDEIEKLEVDQRVGALIELVFDKGLNEALKVVNALENPAILDEFHDVLVDRYYQALVEQKIITPA